MAINKRFASEEYVNETCAPLSHPHSWDEVGEKTVMGDTLTWDGDITGKVTTTDNNGNVYVKVSDATPKYDDFLGVTYTWDNDNKQYETSPVVKGSSRVGNVDDYDTFIFVAFQDNETYTVYSEYGDYSITFPEKGIYFIIDVNMSGHSFITSFTINGYNGFETTEITPLPNKYLDIVETVGSDTLTWDGNTEGLEFGTISNSAEGWSNKEYCISEIVPPHDVVLNGGAVSYVNGFKYIIDVDDEESFIRISEKLVMFNYAPVTLVYEDNVTITRDDFVYNFPKKGIYVSPYYPDSDDNITSITFNGYTGFTKQLVKQEYLPSGGGNAVDVVVDNDYNIIECPLTYDKLKERIESRKPLMINVFHEMIYDGSSFLETTLYVYPAEEILIHYSEGDEGNYIDVKCRNGYYLTFRENGEIAFYSVD